MSPSPINMTGQRPWRSESRPKTKLPIRVERVKPHQVCPGDGGIEASGLLPLYFTRTKYFSAANDNHQVTYA